MNFDFLAAFGTLVFILLLLAVLAQVPLAVWAIIIPVLVIIGLKNAK